MGGYTGAKFAQSKRCPRCTKTKPRAEFTVRRDGYLVSLCKACSRAERRDQRKANRPKALEFSRRASIKTRHGITAAQFDELSAKQGDRCAICDRKGGEVSRRSERLHVDHCHSFDRIRGLLCNNCNRGLGMFQHRPDVLLQAITYLRDADTGLVHRSRIGMCGKRAAA